MILSAASWTGSPWGKGRGAKLTQAAREGAQRRRAWGTREVWGKRIMFELGQKILVAGEINPIMQHDKTVTMEASV